MKAIWNQQVIAESDDTVMVEGNHYFPPNSVKREFLQDSATTPLLGMKYREPALETFFKPGCKK